ncbi:hypothetical protein [Emticicia sp.]
METNLWVELLPNAQRQLPNGTHSSLSIKKLPESFITFGKLSN